MKTRKLGFLLAAAQLTLVSAAANGQFIQWRVSVKFILDVNGNRAPAMRPDGTVNFFVTDQDVRNEINASNAILANWGNGYNFQLVEIIDVAGASQWFGVDARNGTNKAALEAAAKADTATYAFRTNAINVYINGDDDSGVCSLPGGGRIILLGQGSYATIFMHEIGHFFNLCHTQGCACGTCTEAPAACMSGAVDDDLSDTLLDRQCWTRDQVAQNNFGNIYSMITAAQQVAVDFTWQNVMSYHTVDPQRLTFQQIDKAIHASNGARIDVASGASRFVFTQGDDALDGLTAANALRTILGGVVRAGPDDQLWITTGLYPENLFINEPIILRARAGPVTIGN